MAHELLDRLTHGDMRVVGRMPRASNATYLARVETDAEPISTIYKPCRGERPLWDFPAGTLCRREAASFVVSDALGWGLIPPTVLRDGSLGPGSVQLFVVADDTVDMIDLVEDGDPLLMPLAVLDIMLNSADRKVGHCIVDPDGHVWGIDNGLTFHEDPKLRTVLWAWMGLEIPDEIIDDVRALREALDDATSPLCRDLAQLLSPAETRALRARVGDLLTYPYFPEPDPTGPAIPWPPY